MTIWQAIVVATLLLALGLWLMLPRGTTRGRALGTLFALAGVGVLGAELPLLGRWTSNSAFFVLAAITVVSALGTVTMRSPVYCALWFALSLLGTAGLFLLQGAQFLGLATVVVYAGAIVVTFLFVLMLAQPEGHAYFDRLSWEAPLSAGTGALMVGILTLIICGSFAEDGTPQTGIASFADGERVDGVLTQRHVETLGARLFSEHMIAVEVAGLLLMVALIGAAAIVSHGRAGRSRLQSQAEIDLGGHDR